VDIIEIASISFNPNSVEVFELFTSGDISEYTEQETLNIGRAQILIDTSQEKGSPVAIEVLLPTPLVQGVYECLLKNRQKNQKLKSLLIK
jgi:hypothetical protein